MAPSETPIDDLVIDDPVVDTPSTTPDTDFPDPDLSDDPAASSSEDRPSEPDGGEVPPAQPPLASEVTPPAQPQPTQTYQPPAYQPPPQPAPQPEAPKFYAVDELQRAVDQGVITQNQMVEQLQWQAKEQAVQESMERIRQEGRKQTVMSQLQEYAQLIPGWHQAGSPANLQAQPAYTRLLSLGFPATESTQLIALEQTFGTVAQLKQGRASSDRTRQLRDASPAIGRRAPAPSNPSTKRKDPLDALSIEEKRQYKGYIDKGLYSSWDDVRKEVAYVPKHTHSPLMGRRPKSGVR